MKAFSIHLAALFRVLVHLAAGTGAVLAVLLVWALFIERPFLSYENLPFPVQMRHVHAGEVIPLNVKRCNAASGTRTYSVSHELHSISNPGAPPYILRSEVVTIAPGCIEATSRVNVVPPDATPGIYIASGTGIVEGRLRTFAVPWHSQPFEVVQ